MKKCFKCDEVKPLEEFYRHPMMGDGHLNKCKECTKYDVRKNRENRREYYIAYDRQRSKERERIEAIGRRNRQRLKATQKVYQAVKRGKLTRQPCEVCGAEKVEAHHPNYAFPLDVMWLCRKHHADWHRVHGTPKVA